MAAYKVASFDLPDTRLVKKIAEQLKPVILSTGMANLEDIELLRAIDLGLKIKTFSLKGDSFSIDIKKNLIEARKKMKKDKYYKLYKDLK